MSITWLRYGAQVCELCTLLSTNAMIRYVGSVISHKFGKCAIVASTTAGSV